MMAASRVSAAVAGGSLTIVIARALGPGSVGEYAVAQSLITLLIAATTLGVEHGVIYFVGAGKWDARAAAVTTIRLSAVAGAFGAAVGLGLRLLVPSAFGELSVGMTAVVVVSLPFMLTWFYVSCIALASDRYEASMLLPAFQAALMLVFGILAATLFDIRAVIVVITLSSVLAALAAVAWIGRLSRLAAESSGQLRRAIAFGIKGYAANALQLVNYRLDIFILAAVASSAAVGRYSTAVAVTSLLWLLPGALSDVVYPRVARLDASRDEETLALVEAKSLRHATLIMVATAVLMAGVLEILVVPVFGATFRSAIDLGLILLPGTALLGLWKVLTAIIVGRGKPAYSLYGALITTPLTIALYATLIPWLHADGAALASSASYSCSFVLACAFYRRSTGHGALRLFVPTREELLELRALPRAAVDWARMLSRSGGSPSAT